MTDYKKLVDDLRDIGKTMFALGTTHISMDNVSISLAYDKGWGQTANDAADAIEALQAQLPKRGKWKPFDLTYGRSIYSCSVCEQATEVPMCMEKPMYAYCPNCGADMRKMEVQE